MKNPESNLPSAKSIHATKINNRLILLHGPNGSAKTSIIQSIMTAWSVIQKNPRCSYTFNWIFPVERYTKGGMGMNTYSTSHKQIPALPNSKTKKSLVKSL
jgi:hypothetical protein